MLRPIVHAMAVVALAGCATQGGGNAPWRADVAACEAKAPQDSNRQRLAFVDSCMTAKGWRATPACLETQMEGTSFCTYAR
jgi:hypothetical protein